MANTRELRVQRSDVFQNGRLFLPEIRKSPMWKKFASIRACYFRDDLHRCCIVNGCYDILFIHIYLDGWVKHLGIDEAY